MRKSTWVPEIVKGGPKENMSCSVITLQGNPEPPDTSLLNTEL